MLISPEIQKRLEEDKEFLQKSAVVLIRYLTAEDGYKLGLEEVATKLRVPSRKLLEWIAYDPPSIAECWKIIYTAADEYLVTMGRKIIQ